MAAAVAVRSCSTSGSGARGVGGLGKHMDTTGKYVRYTAEQVEALERVYAECLKPSSMRRQQLIREGPILAHIDPKQIKVWFQNRRCRDKQRKESSWLLVVNRKLSAINKLLMEENERLQKQVSRLVDENSYMKQQLQIASLANDTSCESVVTTPQNSLRDANNPAGLLSIAEESLAEFLSKATGTAVDWVQMPGMKPGPYSIDIVAVCNSCTGVAARACGLVNLDPRKIVEILKDRQSWFRDCRSLEVFTTLPAGNGGTIELVYMQMYSPTTLAPARDFWTLRYTTNLEDGSLVFYVENGELSCQMYQRSADMGLGVLFNIASYALLTCMIAQVIGLRPGDFIHTFGDTHAYTTHVTPLLEQLQKQPRPFPVLTINPDKKDIDSFESSDFKLHGYNPHSKIEMKMAV